MNLEESKVQPELVTKIKRSADFIFFMLSVFWIGSESFSSFDWFPHWDERSIVFRSFFVLMICPIWIMVLFVFTAFSSRVVDFFIGWFYQAES